MIAPDVIRRISDEVIAQITMGCKAYRVGDSLGGELHMSLAQTALLKLQRLLDAPSPKPPLRKLKSINADLYAALEAAEALLKLHGYPAFKNSDSIRAQARAALRKADGDAA